MTIVNAVRSLGSWAADRVAGLLVCVLLFAVAGVCMAVAVNNIAHVAGLKGSSGTITIERCWEKGTDRGRAGTTHCEGTFRADDGSTAEEPARLQGNRKAGDEVTVRRSEHTYYAIEPMEAYVWAALFFGSWLILAAGLPFAGSGVRPESAEDVRRAGRQVRGTWFAKAALWLVAGGVAGVLVSPFLLIWFF